MRPGDGYVFPDGTVYRGTTNTSGPITRDGTGLAHGTRSGKTSRGIFGDRSEGWRTVQYCAQPETTSYNWVVDFDGTIFELTGYTLSAWHATYLNRRSRSVALAQANAGDPLTVEQLRSFRWLVGELDRRGLVAARPAASEDDAGWIEHMSSAQGRAFGKTDVGTLDWRHVLP